MKKSEGKAHKYTDEAPHIHNMQAKTVIYATQQVNNHQLFYGSGFSSA